MDKFTKGPWTVEYPFGEDTPSIALAYNIDRAGSPIVIATTFDDEYVPVDTTQCRANAQLMATSPELLQCCRNLLMMLVLRDTDMYCEGIEDQHRKIARLVIEKATTLPERTQP